MRVCCGRARNILTFIPQSYTGRERENGFKRGRSETELGPSNFQAVDGHSKFLLEFVTRLVAD